jgi:zinc protease
MIQFKHQRYKEPEVHSLPGPEDITRQVLPNGITVLCRANFNSPSVVVQGYLAAGSLRDPDDKLGLADFTALALMRGTAQREFQTIYEALESAGASLSFGGGTHSASFGGKSLAEDLGLLLSLASEALQQPVFPPEYVERLRAQLLTGLSIRAQDTASMASLVFDQIIYPEHPYRRPEDGYAETIAAINRQDLLDFHQKYYGPQGLVIVVVGAVDPAAVVEQVGAFLGNWHNPLQTPPSPLPALQPLPATRLEKVTLPGKSQADIVMGVAGPARNHPNYSAASLGNSVLGQFGMMGRIGESVREKAGLAYYASSGLSGGLGPGPWDVTAGVDPANIEKAIGLIQEEIRRFINEPVTAEELADSQASYIGSLPLSMESNYGVAAALTNLERYQLGLDYYRRYPGIVRAVTPQQILEIARQYLDPDRMGIAVAGP